MGLVGLFLVAVGAGIIFIPPTINVAEEGVNKANKIMENLKIEDVVVGEGEAAKIGDTVSVDYTGTLMDGTKFDSSYDRGVPISFKLGMGQVIKGWEVGIEGMKVGGTRKLTIPPEFGYGNNPVGPIPAGSTLQFEVKLVQIK
jgi:FKBP-type peptidyl-prolyl cis-trans isomerase